MGTVLCSEGGGVEAAGVEAVEAAGAVPAGAATTNGNRHVESGGFRTTGGTSSACPGPEELVICGQGGGRTTIRVNVCDARTWCQPLPCQVLLCMLFLRVRVIPASG